MRTMSTPPGRSTIRWRIIALSSVAALALAACNGDEQDVGDDDAEEQDEDQDIEDEGEDADADDGPGDGDPDASSVTVGGEEVDLHFTECLEQFDHDGVVEITARGHDPFMPDHDPELELVLDVDEDPFDDGARVSLRREPEHVEDFDDFDGHRWELSDGTEVEDIGWHGSSAEVELELTDVGPDEPEGEEGDLETVAFDLVC